jgi:uncharacterized protein (TIGR02145 family)
MDRNLGASQAATDSTDFLSYGSSYQWGRGGDGHQCINWTSATTSDGIEQSRETSILSAADTPGNANFITTSTNPIDWRSTQNDNLWQGVSGINNPCPRGYRVPTEAEWNNERDSWDGVLNVLFPAATNNAGGAFASRLKLPLAGGRLFSSGSLSFVGTFGYYWSSSVSSTAARVLRFGSSNATMDTFFRASGISVRCLKD